MRSCPRLRSLSAAGRTGQPCQIIFCLAPLRDRDGKLTGYAAIAYDITERKAQEKDSGNCCSTS